MTQLEAWQRLVDVPDREVQLHAQIRRLEEELQSAHAHMNHLRQELAKAREKTS